MAFLAANNPQLGSIRSAESWKIIGNIMNNIPTSIQPEMWLGLFISQTAILLISLIIMLIASKGRLARYGFRPAGDIQLKQIILWGLGIGIISALIGSSLPGKEVDVTGELSFFQTIILIWIYASISEEVFTRGLIQSSLAPLVKYGITLSKWRISLPVLLSALFFGLLHLIQTAMGMSINKALVIVLFAFLLGIVAGYHREKSGSLAPAIIVHMFANIGGSIAGFLISFYM